MRLNICNGMLTKKISDLHEIVVGEDKIMPATPRTPAVVGILEQNGFPPRPRGISVDDAKCSKCHSTRNVLNLDRFVSPPIPGSTPGTDGVPPGTVKVKNKPNWDTYDSWGGMLPFNRDRIYKGSVEAAAFRKLFNLWTWQDNDTVRPVTDTQDEGVSRRLQGRKQPRRAHPYYWPPD